MTSSIAPGATGVNFSERSILGWLGENFHHRLRTIAQDKHLEAGDILCDAGSAFGGAYLVVSGRLAEKSPEGEARELLAGDVVDELGLVIGGHHACTLEAREPTHLLKFAPEQFHSLVADDEPLLEQLSSLASERLREQQLWRILRRLFGPLDEVIRDHVVRQIEWLELKAGEVLFRQSDPGDALYALMDGRMAAFAEDEGGPAFLNEILPGETIGEIAIVTGDDRSATVKAIKRSLLVRLARADFEAIAEEHPTVYKAFARVLVTWLQRSHQHEPLRRDAKEVALLAHNIAPGVLSQAAAQLERGLSLLGRTLLLSSTGLRAMGAKYLFDVSEALAQPLYHPRNTRFRLWLDEQKRRHDFIVYESDGDGSVWDRLCIDRANEVLILADAASSPEAGLLERLLRDEEMTTKRLALIHGDEGFPADTGRWLKGRNWTGHHHIRMNRAADFQRLARFVADQAIGLVLAGGGARGFAHIGIIRALHQAGIPIDLVGGTSSGGMVALTYAMDPDPDALEWHNQNEWVARKPLSRFGLPILSILDHTKWDRIYMDAFQQKAIEDLWLPAFSISCNLDTGQTVVHSTGLAWKAARATASLPVFLAPVLFDGQGHVDGGVVNNMPTDVMRQRTRGPVFTVSLGHDTREKLPIESYPSPWRLALERLPGLKGRVHPHTVPKVILRLSTMQDQAAFDERARLADFLFLPPVTQYSMTDIARVDDIVAIGHAYGSEQLRTWAGDPAFVRRLAKAGVRTAS